MARQAADRRKRKRTRLFLVGRDSIEAYLFSGRRRRSVSGKPGIEEFSSCVVSKALSRGSACISSSSLIGWCIFLFS